MGLRLTEGVEFWQGDLGLRNLLQRDFLGVR